MEWISVKDKLPEIEKRILFYVSGRAGCRECIGYISSPQWRGKDVEGNEYYWFVDESENTAFLEHEITHWMPLPAPPKKCTQCNNPAVEYTDFCIGCHNYRDFMGD